MFSNLYVPSLSSLRKAENFSLVPHFDIFTSSAVDPNPARINN